MDRTIHEKRAHPSEEIVKAVAYAIWEKGRERGVPSNPQEDWNKAKRIIEIRATES